MRGPGHGRGDLREDGSVADIGETGELCCTQPFPAMPVCFWGDEDGSKYRAAYFETFPGIWAQGDFALQTENGGYVIQGRSDATLNPGGVRIGTAEIYRQVEGLDEVLESICVGQDWDDDVRVVLFVSCGKGCNWMRICRIGFARRSGRTPRPGTCRPKSFRWRTSRAPSVAKSSNWLCGISSTAARSATWMRWPTRNRWKLYRELPELKD